MINNSKQNRKNACNGSVHNNNNNKTYFNSNIEGFVGIRKDNARLIFGLLLSFIILDLVYCINNL